MSAKQQYQNRREQASQARKAAVLKAAGECFAESGYRHTPVETIARRAGVSKGLVFSFFPNKQKLFEAVVDRSLAHWANLSDRKASRDSGDIEEELRSLFLASFELYEQHPIVQLFYRQKDLVGENHTKLVDRQNRLWRKRIGELLEKGIEQGLFRRDIDITRTALIIHELQVALLLKVMSGSRSRKPDNATINLAIDLLLRSLHCEG